MLDEKKKHAYDRSTVALIGAPFSWQQDLNLHLPCRNPAKRHLPDVANISLGFLPLNHLLGRMAIVQGMVSGGSTAFVRILDLSCAWRIPPCALVPAKRTIFLQNPGGKSLWLMFWSALLMEQHSAVHSQHAPGDPVAHLASSAVPTR